jgi:hypothetical protein
VIDQGKALSRALAVAQAVSGQVLTGADVKAKRVVLTGDSAVLNSANGRGTLIDSCRLLLRIAGELTVVLPATAADLEREVQLIANAASRLCTVDFARAPDENALRAADAILNIGFSSMPALPWTCVNSNGWIVRATSTGAALPDDVAQPNPIGALCAASIGVAEVFKRIVGIPSDIAPLLDTFEFSLFEYSVRFDSPGPLLPQVLHLPNTLIAGGGAIGNGVCLLLSQLPLSGRVHIVDKQSYNDENFGTCVLLEDEGWIGADKASRLAVWLKREQYSRGHR